MCWLVKEQREKRRGNAQGQRKETVVDGLNIRLSIPQKLVGELMFIYRPLVFVSVEMAHDDTESNGLDTQCQCKGKRLKQQTLELGIPLAL